MKYLKIKYRLLAYLTSFTACKNNSENDQSPCYFRDFFFFLVPQDLIQTVGLPY